MTFGARLAKQRERLGLSQTDLGKGLGTDGEDASKSVVLGWEKDRHSPRADQLKMICERLQCSADFLLFGQAERWPLDLVPMDLYLALEPHARGFAQAKFLEAIEQHSQSRGKREPKLSVTSSYRGDVGPLPRTAQNKHGNAFRQNSSHTPPRFQTARRERVFLRLYAPNVQFGRTFITSYSIQNVRIGLTVKYGRSILSPRPPNKAKEIERCTQTTKLLAATG